MPPVSIMIKPASSLCALSCKYCFYRDVSEHREHLGFGKMDRETTQILIKKLLSYADGSPVAVTFQGGEPTTAGLDYFKYFLKTEKELNEKNSKVFYSIQTNGTNINDEWAEFFAENNFLAGLSLDGSRRDNKFRGKPNGESTFDEAVRAADIFRKHNVEFNILTVLTGYCADNGEQIYKYFRNKGYKYLQFIPCLRPFDSEEKSELYMTANQYADFLIKTFRLYANDYMTGNYISIRQFDNWVRLFLNQPVEQCGILGKCNPQFVAEANGNIYPCDFYCTDEYLLGNIIEDDFKNMADSDKAKSFLNQNNPQKSKRCKGCEYYFLCRGGGCKRTQQSEDYCEAYKKFFKTCLPMFNLFR